MDKDQILNLQNQYVLETYTRDMLLVRGAGSRVWDADDREYLDFTSGISVCNLGHCHPYVTEVIQRQAARLVHVSNLFYNEYQPQLAAAISENSFGGRVFFGNSGAEANEGLIKFARKWGNEHGRYEIICMNESFHGRTLATLAATGQPKYREGFEPAIPGFRFVDFNDLEALDKAIDEKTAAVLVEPVQGEGGVVPATQEFLSGARELCDKHEILLLFDEVQSGMGRTGTMFAHQRYGVQPDGMSLAKALGNGYPIGAFIVQWKWENVLVPGTHASTFGGTPLACAAALAVFEAIEESDLLFNCRKMGEHLRGALVKLTNDHQKLKDVRGMGLMLGIVADEAVAPVLAAARSKGLLILPAGPNIIRLLPPLNVSQEDIDQAVAIVSESLEVL